MQESGLIKKWKKDSMASEAKYINRNEYIPITTETFYSTFIIFGTGNMFAIIVFTIEIIYKHK